MKVNKEKNLIYFNLEEHDVNYDEMKLIIFDLNSGIFYKDNDFEETDEDNNVLKNKIKKTINQYDYRIFEGIDNSLYNLFYALKNINSSRLAFYTALKRFNDFKYLINYDLMGIEITKLTYIPTIEVKDLSKKFINYIKDENLVNTFLNEKFDRCINLNKIVFNNCLEYALNNDNKYIIRSLLKFIIDYFNNEFYDFFIINYNYNYKKLIDHFLYLNEIEGLAFPEAFDLYKDTIRFNALVSKNKIDKYPKYLKSNHDIFYNKYKKFKNEYNEELFKTEIKLKYEYNEETSKKYLELKDDEKKFEFLSKLNNTNMYFIICPKSTNEIKNEGSTLNHCVATYIDSVCEGKTNIVFLRDITKPKDPLITIEIKNNKVVQIKGKNNRSPNVEEMQFINDYIKVKNLESIF